MPGFDKKYYSPLNETQTDTPYIRVEEVSKNFGSVAAVSNVSLSLQKGQILGLLGSDGAGKTTLLRMIATMIRPSSGRIYINNLDVVRQKEKVKELIGYMPQRFGLYQDLTVAENLDFFMDIYGIYGRQRDQRRKYYLEFSNLLPYINRQAGDLSGGMKQKLGLASVLVHEPDVLILDEPTNGVDPVSRQEFWEILGKMKSEGMTLLVSTAYMDEGEKCDRLLLIHGSRVLAEASPQELQSQFSDLEEAMINRIEKAEKP